MDFHPGDVVRVGHGRYELKCILGHGDRSVVYQALGVEGESVALKVSPEPSWGTQHHWRAIHQAPSEHLVRVLEADQGPEGFVTVMERVEGVDFRQLCDFIREERRRVAPRLAVELCYQAARGLVDVLARTGQAHGDLKPANIMLDRRGVVKLLDYGAGAARAFGVTGRLPPTAIYLAPEQLDLAGAWRDDPRSDLFALGAVLYELVMGVPLYDFDASEAAYQRLMIMARSDISVQLQRVRDEQPALSGVLRLILARDPEDRLQSCSEMAAMLAGLAAELPPVLPLELFAETLYQALHGGRWTPELEACLPERVLENSLAHDSGRRRPNPAPAGTAPVSRLVKPASWEDELVLQRRPGIGMLIGMLLMIATVIGITLMLWKPLRLKEAVRSGAEFYTSQPAFVSPGSGSPTGAP